MLHGHNFLKKYSPPLWRKRSGELISSIFQDKAVEFKLFFSNLFFLNYFTFKIVLNVSRPCNLNGKLDRMFTETIDIIKLKYREFIDSQLKVEDLLGKNMIV